MKRNDREAMKSIFDRHSTEWILVTSSADEQSLRAYAQEQGRPAATFHVLSAARSASSIDDVKVKLAGVVVQAPNSLIVIKQVEGCSKQLQGAFRNIYEANAIKLPDGSTQDLGANVIALACVTPEPLLPELRSHLREFTF